MARLTPEMERRRAARAERLRRDRMRRRRQSAALVLALIVVVVAGLALAFRPASGGASPAGGGSTSTTRTAGSETTSTVSATTTPAVQATAPVTPAKPPVKATVTPAKAVIKPLKPAPGVKTIVVDKSSQRVTLYKANGKPVDSFRCSSGVIYPRVGRYKVFGHDPASSSLADNTHFYYFTKFALSDKGNNIGFHSNPQNPDGSVVGKIGKPVSHGCVRLEKSKAKFVFSWAVTGTRVIVKQ